MTRSHSVPQRNQTNPENPMKVIAFVGCLIWLTITLSVPLFN